MCKSPFHSIAKSLGMFVNFCNIDESDFQLDIAIANLKWKLQSDLTLKYDIHVFVPVLLFGQ